MQSVDGKNIIVGVLALQGSFVEHKKMIAELGYQSLEVRTSEDLKKVDGLIIPGGESTTMNHHLVRSDLRELLIEKINNGFPVYGTCAGAILMAKTVDNESNSGGLAVMDVNVSRNAYGAQMDSFEEKINLQFNGKSLQVPAIYIRAPKINSVGQDVEVLSKNKNNEIVMARQKNRLVTTFHPELTVDKTVHTYFIEKIIQTF